MIRALPLVLATLAALPSACTTPSPAMAPPADISITGRVLSSRTLITIEQRVQVDMRAYVFKIDGPAGETIEFTGPFDDCPSSFNNGQLYRVTLRRRHYLIALTIDKIEDYANLTDYLVIACEAVR